jgi:hypothetical protein
MPCSCCIIFTLVGIHSVFNGIRNNRCLRKLYINYNELDDDKLMYGAFELSFNKALTYCSIEGNKGEPRWMMPNTYIKCRLLEKLPSIQTSLDNNKRIAEDPVLSRIFGAKPHNYKNEEGFDGSWDAKRFWKKTDYSNLEKNREKESDDFENEKIRVENEYVEEQTRQYLQSMIAYIDSTEAGAAFVRNVAKYISEHIASLYRVDPEWGQWEEEASSAVNGTSSVPAQLDTLSLFAAGSAEGLLPALRSPKQNRSKVKFYQETPLPPPEASVDVEMMKSSQSVTAATEAPQDLPQANSDVTRKQSLFPTIKKMFRGKSIQESVGRAAEVLDATTATESCREPNAFTFPWMMSNDTDSKKKAMNENMLKMLLEKDYPSDHPAYQTQQRMKLIQRQKEFEAEVRRQEEAAKREAKHIVEVELSKLPKTWSVVQGTHLCISFLTRLII